MWASKVPPFPAVGVTVRVSFFGFSITPGALSTKYLFEKYLPSVAGREFTWRKEKWQIYVADRPQFYAGLLLRIRDQRRFCELQNDGDLFKLKVTELADQNRLVDFNFLGVSKATNTGILQHYRGACGMTMFCQLIKNFDREARGIKRKKLLERIADMQGRTKLRRQISKKYGLSADACALFRPEDFRRLVNQMLDVSSVSFDSEYYKSVGSVFRPFSGNGVKKERVTVSLDANGVLPQLRRAVAGLVGNPDCEEVSVRGLDATGYPITYRQEANLKGFGYCDFDDIADEVDFNLADVGESRIIDRIEGFMGADDAFFSLKQ